MAVLTVLFTVILCLISTVVSRDILHQEQRKRRAAPCNMDWKPVCGTNGVTYGNKCMMEAKGVELASEGRCKTECICFSYHNPVCGMDGRTYKNKCELGCAGVKLAQRGACLKPNCTCTEQWEPVCGANGVTYGNNCSLECDSEVLFASNGACGESSCICSERYIPVCGNKGSKKTTYGNYCSMFCARASYIGEGVCPEQAEPRCVCVAETYTPVCGKNGRTYFHLCHLGYAGVELEQEGRCPKRECNCTATYSVSDTVCSVNAITYQNECELKCQNDELAYRYYCRVYPGQAVCRHAKYMEGNPDGAGGGGIYSNC